MKLYLYLFVVCFHCVLVKARQYNKLHRKIKKHRFDSIYSLVEKEYFIERDSFSEGIPETVYPKNKTKFSSERLFVGIFEIDNGKAEKFRLVVQNSEDNNIDETNIFKFNIDGKIVNIIIQPYMINESHAGNYYCIPSAYAVEFLESLRNGSRVKMQAANLDEYTTRTITSEEINNIIKTYQYYQELGGELDSPDVPTNQDN